MAEIAHVYHRASGGFPFCIASHRTIVLKMIHSHWRRYYIGKEDTHVNIKPFITQFEFTSIYVYVLKVERYFMVDINNSN